MFGIATISLYVFIFGRLYKTFQDSAFELSKFTFWSIIILITLNTIAQISVAVFFFMLPFQFTLDQFYDYLHGFNTFLLTSDFLLNIVILAIFIHKLHQLIINLEHDGIDFIEGSEIKLNNAQTKMLGIITKHAILSTFDIMSHVLCYISIIIGSNIGPMYVVDLYFLGYSNLVKAIHGFVVAFTLYLNFSFNNELYFRLCNKCHVFCYHRLEKKTMKKLSTQLSMNTVVSDSNNDKTENI